MSYDEINDLLEQAYCFSSDNTFAIERILKVLEILVERIKELEETDKA